MTRETMTERERGREIGEGRKGEREKGGERERLGAAGHKERENFGFCEYKNFSTIKRSVDVRIFVEGRHTGMRAWNVGAVESELLTRKEVTSAVQPVTATGSVSTSSEYQRGLQPEVDRGHSTLYNLE